MSIYDISIPIHLQYYDEKSNIITKQISEKIIKITITNDNKLFEILNSTIQTIFNYTIDYRCV